MRAPTTRGRLSPRGHLMRRTTELKSLFWHDKGASRCLIVQKKCGKVNHIFVHTLCNLVNSHQPQAYNSLETKLHPCEPPRLLLSAAERERERDRARAHRATLNNFRTKQRFITAAGRLCQKKTPLTRHKFCNCLSAQKCERAFLAHMSACVSRQNKTTRGNPGRRATRTWGGGKKRGGELTLKQHNKETTPRTDAFIFRI